MRGRQQKPHRRAEKVIKKRGEYDSKEEGKKVREKKSSGDKREEIT